MILASGADGSTGREQSSAPGPPGRMVACSQRCTTPAMAMSTHATAGQREAGRVRSVWLNCGLSTTSSVSSSSRRSAGSTAVSASGFSRYGANGLHVTARLVRLIPVDGGQLDSRADVAQEAGKRVCGVERGQCDGVEHGVHTLPNVVDEHHQAWGQGGHGEYVCRATGYHRAANTITNTNVA